MVMDKTLTPSQWTNLKWTTPKNNNPADYYLMFLAASINKLHITSAYVYPLQPLATTLNSLKSVNSFYQMLSFDYQRLLSIRDSNQYQDHTSVNIIT